MSLRSWIEKLLNPTPRIRSRRDRSRRLAQRPKQWARPWLEALETRVVPSNLVVTNNADSGAGSLRDAINTSMAGDSISFAPSLAGMTITLTTGQLTISHSLTINGLGADQLTVSGAVRAGNVVGVQAGVFSIMSGDVTLSGMKIMYGYIPYRLKIGEGSKPNPSSLGGGVYCGNTSGTTTLSSLDIFLNTAATGGGIFSKAGTLSISNSTIEDNQAFYGGAGIFQTSGNVTITNSTIANNALFQSSFPQFGFNFVASGIESRAFPSSASLTLVHPG